MKQEYLYYALGAAVLVIVILAGALVYAIGTSRESGPLPSGVQAPALSPDQLQSPLPAGHPNIGGGAPTQKTPSIQTPKQKESSTKK